MRQRDLKGWFCWRKVCKGVIFGSQFHFPHIAHFSTVDSGTEFCSQSAGASTPTCTCKRGFSVFVHILLYMLVLYVVVLCNSPKMMAHSTRRRNSRFHVEFSLHPVLDRDSIFIMFLIHMIHAYPCVWYAMEKTRFSICTVNLCKLAVFSVTLTRPVCSEGLWSTNITRSQPFCRGPAIGIQTARS